MRVYLKVTELFEKTRGRDTKDCLIKMSKLRVTIDSEGHYIKKWDYCNYSDHIIILENTVLGINQNFDESLWDNYRVI